MPGAGHVLHHKGGAGQMLLHELRNQAAVEVVAASRRRGGDIGHRFALVKIGAALRASRAGRYRGGAHNAYQQQPAARPSLHPSSLSVIGPILDSGNPKAMSIAVAGGRSTLAGNARL